jgi:hypothetical protein
MEELEPECERENQKESLEHTNGVFKSKRKKCEKKSVDD